MHVGSAVSQASVDRAAARRSLSRQPSTTTSGNSTPARQSLDVTRHLSSTHTFTSRPSFSRDHSHASVTSTAAHAGTPLPPSHTTTHLSPTSPLSPDGATTSKTEIDLVKAENEALRHRVRVLERALDDRRRDSSTSNTSDIQHRQSIMMPDHHHHRHIVSPGVAAWAADGGIGGVAGPRERSESQSTTTSSRRGLVGTEDDVKVGESAGNAGILPGR